MQPHQQRVVDELIDLEDKANKLHSFIISDKFESIVGDPDECSRLVKQRNIMDQYVQVLKERIENFK